MSPIYSKKFLLLLSLITLVNGHARIKYPRPLSAPTDGAGGNYYNEPLRADGSSFPCKGLHKNPSVNQNPTATWKAGEETYFEILGHNTPSGEGSLAAHSGGSCQASISFDNGETWKVLHSYHGGCPRGVKLNSNMAGPNQTFPFVIPENTKAGKALFSWTWIAVTGNRNEMFQNCASVMIEGSGTSTLDDYPDMFVGDMTIAGHIGAGECRSTSRAALEYPNPGTAVTVTEMAGIPFKRPTGGKCYSKATVAKEAGTPASTAVPSTPAPSTAAPSTASPVIGSTAPAAQCENSLPTTISLVVKDTTYPCTCVCEKPKA